MIEYLEVLLESFGFTWDQSAPLLLFLSSFLSATLLPGSSEATLFATLSYSSYSHLYLFAIATLGNTVGGYLNYLFGLWLPNRTEGSSRSRRSVAWLQQYGYWTLLLSWLPVIGDAICLGAGWLRMKSIPSFICILVGKAIRYAILIMIFLELL
jgi:membrane protein YqaA with SNARE-associated domain